MSSLWQSTDWESFQKSLGRKCVRVQVGPRNLLAIIHPILLGYSSLYFARIPSLTKNEWDLFEKELIKISQKKKIVFSRYDSMESQDPECIKNHKVSHSPQPETTLLLDLTLSEKELLAQMKRKGRYNIGLAEKKGVKISEANSEKQKKAFVEEFYSLLTETTSRDGFSGHQQEFYQKMMETLSQASVQRAQYEGKTLAALINVRHNDTEIYYYGASSNTHREVMAPYLLQWEAIKKAKKAGCLHYDFLGIAEEDAPPDHPWKGITSFKKKFGGDISSTDTAKDIIHSRSKYWIYQVLKTIQKIKKRLKS